jgi:lysophospholipase L1-like esterase
MTPRLIAFGDSITVGLYASTGAQSYAGIVAHHIGATLDNRAVSGSIAVEHLAQIQAYVAQPSDTVIYLTGFNDEWHGTPLEAYRMTLREALGLAPHSYIGNCLRMVPMGYAATALGFASDARTADMNEIIAEETRAAGCHLVDACAAYDPLNSHDHAHPNDAGHAQIARTFLVAMRRIVYMARI